MRTSHSKNHRKTPLKAFLLMVALCALPLQVLAQSCGTRDLISELSESDRARLDALVAPHPFPEGNLWRAEKPDSSVTVVGTIHIPDTRLEGIVAKVRDKVAEADVLILEATADDEARLQALAAEKPEMFFIQSGPTMIDLLSEEEWTLVKDRLAPLGVPGFLAAKFQPWYLSLTLAIPPCAMSAIQSGEHGLDRQLENIATAANVPRTALDDSEAVLRLFSDEPMEKQLDGLRITLETQIDGDASTSTLIEGYFSGRIRETWEFTRILVQQAEIENGEALFEELNQSILIGRNKDWEPKIIERVDGKAAVLAVGAAHLSGESGVLRVLERAGYKVTPLQP